MREEERREKRGGADERTERRRSEKRGERREGITTGEEQEEERGSRVVRLGKGGERWADFPLIALENPPLTFRFWETKKHGARHLAYFSCRFVKDQDGV